MLVADEEFVTLYVCLCLYNVSFCLLLRQHFSIDFGQFEYSMLWSHFLHVSYAGIFFLILVFVLYPDKNWRKFQSLFFLYIFCTLPTSLREFNYALSRLSCSFIRSCCILFSTVSVAEPVSALRALSSCFASPNQLYSWICFLLIICIFLPL